MGGTSQGNSDLIQGGQGFARAFMEAQNYRRQRALQDAQLAEKTGNLDAAEQAYGRVFPGFHFPTVTIPGQEAQPGQNQIAAPSATSRDVAGGQYEIEHPQGQAGQAPQAAQAPITMKYDPSQGMTFGQFVAGSPEFAHDADVRRMLPAFGNRPMREVLALDQGLRHTVIDPLTGMQTTTGGLFPNVGQHMQMHGNISARADQYAQKLHEAYATGDTALGDQIAAQASQFRALALQKDPTLSALIPDYQAMWQAQRGQVSIARARLDAQQADRAVAIAREQLNAARTPQDRLAAWQQYQAAVAAGKPIWQRAGVTGYTAGERAPEQIVHDEFTPTQVGQPVSVAGRNGTFDYVQFHGYDGKPYFNVYKPGTFDPHNPQSGVLYRDDKMPAENAAPRISVNVAAPNQPTGEPIDDGAGNVWQQMRNPKTGKLEYRATSGPHQGTWSNEPRMPGTSAPHGGGDMKGWSDAQLQDFLTSPATSKGQITDHNQAESELKRRGYVQDAKGAWSKKGRQDHPNRTFASKGTHRIYTDDGGKTWFDASTNEPVK